MRLTLRLTLGALAAITLVTVSDSARAGEDEIDRGFFKRLYSKEAKRYYTEPVPLEQIRSNPTNFLNVYFRSWVRFHRGESLETPEYTPFNKEKYMNFSVWAADAKLWIEEQRMNDLPFMFAEKDDRIVYKVAALQQYDMIRIYGVVRTVFMGEPWIEVIDIDRAAKSTLNDAVLTHISVAEALDSDDMKREAVDEYTRALSYDLTADVAAELWKRKGILYLQSEMAAEAVYSLRKAIALKPEQAGTHLALAEASQMAGRYRDGLREAQEALRLEGRQSRAYALIGLCWRQMTLQRLEALGINVSEQLSDALRRKRESVRPRDRFRGQGRSGTDEVQVSYLISTETKAALRRNLETAVREGRKAVYLDPMDPDAGQWLAATKKALDEFDQRIKEMEAKRAAGAAEADKADKTDKDDGFDDEE